MSYGSKHCTTTVICFGITFDECENDQTWSENTCEKDNIPIAQLPADIVKRMDDFKPAQA